MSYTGDDFLDKLEETRKKIMSDNKIRKPFNICLNCKYYEAQGMIGYCEIFHKTIIHNDIEKGCFSQGEI